MKTKLREIINKHFYPHFEEPEDLDQPEFEQFQHHRENAITEILSLVKECAPGEKPPQVMITHGDISHPMSSPYVEGYNAAIKQFLANIEGEE